MYSKNSTVEIVTDYINENVPLMEIDFTNIKKKAKIIKNIFFLPDCLVSDCTVSEKVYSDFSIIVVKCNDCGVIGFILSTDSNNYYQVISYFTKNSFNGFNKIDEYIINDCESSKIIQVQKSVGCENFTVIDRCLDSDSKDNAIFIINQRITDILRGDSIKFYKIRRKF